MGYVKVDVPKPTKISPGKGGDKFHLVTIIDVDDIKTHAPRDDKGIVISGNHVFKDNAYAIQMYVTPDSISVKATSEGDVDAEGIIQEVIMAHPGSSKDIREFRSNWLNRNVMIFIDHCSDSVTDQLGAPCAPLRMKIEGTDDKDANKSVFTFTSSNKGPDIAIYEGTLTLSAPVATVAADATTVDLSSGEGEYQLTDNAAATELTSCTNATDGMIFTLLGSGGTNPASITDTNDFVLKSGASWSGIAGATITFKAFKDGASSWKFFELSRS